MKKDRFIEDIEDLEASIEGAAVITTKRRDALDDSEFAVPGKRKLPLDTCARVRNAMARFSQTQGLTADEKSTAINKILRAASKCGIDSTGFRDKYKK
jgi:hypothetical protein